MVPVAGLVLAFLAAACPADPVPAGAGAVVTDALTSDPQAIDPAHPPAMATVSFDSGAATLGGILYLADGAGPHPTVVLLHGFPGNEKNLDLAQALRRSGFNVLFFHYRGSWGSGGDFSFGNVVEDVAAALDFLRTTSSVARFRVDGDRLALVGHSMGGFAALQGAAADPAVRCVAAIAPWNLAVLADVFESGSGAAAARAGFAEVVDNEGPIRGLSGEAAVREIRQRRDEFDLGQLVPALRGKSVLLVGAKGDRVLPREQHLTPLLDAYEAEPAIHLRHELLEGDHSFSWTRIALARTVTAWLRERCWASTPPT